MALEFKDLLTLAKTVAKANSSAPVAYSFGDKSYTYSQLQDTLRDEFKEIAGTYSLYRQNKNTVFALMEQTFDDVLPQRVLDQYSQFADIKTFAQGDKPIFTQKITTASRRRAKQFILDECIYVEIEKQLFGAAQNVQASNKASENGFNEAEMDRLISIADSYGKSAIYCTYEFAAQMVPAQGWVSDEMRNQKWSNGYLANYKGHQVIVMAQSYEDEKNEIKIIDPSLAYIIPTGAEKPVKIAFEGQTIVDEYTNYDRSREIQIYKKVGVRAIFSNAICVYQNTSLNRDYTLPVPDTTIGN